MTIHYPLTYSPSAHASNHENGGSDEIDVSGLSGQTLFVPYNAKIADITHADTNKHMLDLAAALSESRKIISIEIGASRIAGTGYFYTYPNEESNFNSAQIARQNSKIVMLAAGTNRLQYSLSVANDDFDLYCFGYVVEV